MLTKPVVGYESGTAGGPAFYHRDDILVSFNMISDVEGTATKRLHQRCNATAVCIKTRRLLVSNFGQYNS